MRAQPLAPQPTAAPTRSSLFGSLPNLPALDGIRGLAVFAVFLFHVGSPLAPGGFLGVSVFFTLSGFLITRLLLSDVSRTRTVDLVRFWVRRLRRLLPAALLAIVFVLILSATVLRFDADQLRGDVLATLGYAANWRFLYTGQSYANLYQAPSPVLHFWSLAIEEQFYLIFPVLVWFLARVSRPRRFRPNLRLVLIGLVAASIGATLLASRSGDFDFVYYSLPTRAPELLLGAVLATSIGAARVVGTRARRWHTLAGFGALVAITVVCATATRTSSWIGDGGLPLFAVLSAVLVFAAIPRGPLARMLGVLPLRELGKISYGVYVYHWPVILWLTSQRAGLDGTALVGLQAAVTLAIAIPSYVLIERPIRRGRALLGRRARFAAPAAIAATALLVVLVTVTLTRPPSIDLAGATDQLAHDARAAAKADANKGAPRVTFYGDSSALTTALGMSAWGESTHRLVLLPGVSGRQWLGCGIARAGVIRHVGVTEQARPGCADWATEWVQDLETARPDIAVIEVGPVEVLDRKLPGDDQFRAPGDPVLDAYLKSEMLAAADVFLSRGITTVWITSPYVDIGRDLQPPLPAPDPGSNPARMDAFNKLIREVADERPALRVVDLEHWTHSLPGGPLDPTYRPDGIHFTVDAATKVAKWLGPAILHAASRGSHSR
jgi:peptidoglycan/LPS O-acetylase OafA/YrhL